VKLHYWLSSLAILALLSGSAVQAQEKKLGQDPKKLAPVFHALEGMSDEVAQTKAQAWFKVAVNNNAAKMQQFQNIWKNQEATVLERLAATFEAGDATAAQLLSAGRDVNAPAPKEVAPLFKNAKADPFFRNNLALAYARSLSNRRIHEEALEILKTTALEQVADPAAYLFHRAVCEHALLQKAEARSSILRLLKEGVDAPDRFKTLGVLMLDDMQTWKEKDLAAVARKMDNIERRLELARGGPVTQEIQRDVIARLDELIKEMENKAKQQQQGQGQPNDGSCPDGSQPKDGDSPGNQAGDPKQPMKDSKLGGQSGSGKVDPVRVRKMIDGWGNLPPADQVRIEREITDLIGGMTPQHRQIYEDYFRRIRDAELQRSGK
jgi:hypothetical protein